MNKERITTFKSLDYFAQLLLLAVSLTWLAITALVNKPDSNMLEGLIYAASTILLSQLLSCILNRIFLPVSLRHKSRFIVEFIYLVFLVFFILQYFYSSDLLNIMGYFFFFSPILLFVYLSICYSEYKKTKG